jgi:hypothetical protein
MRRRTYLLYVLVFGGWTIACNSPAVELPPFNQSTPSSPSAGIGGSPQPTTPRPSGVAGVGAATAPDAGSQHMTGVAGATAPDDVDAGEGPPAAHAGSVSDGGTTAALPDAIRAWWAYERAAAFQSVDTNVSVPLRDGVTLACSLSRPATGSAPASGKFPGLMVEYTPYALAAGTLIPEADFFAQRGYNAIVCHVRGTGLSAERGTTRPLRRMDWMRVT